MAARTLHRYLLAPWWLHLCLLAHWWLRLCTPYLNSEFQGAVYVEVQYFMPKWETSSLKKGQLQARRFVHSSVAAEYGEEQSVRASLALDYKDKTVCPHLREQSTDAKTIRAQLQEPWTCGLVSSSRDLEV